MLISKPTIEQGGAARQRERAQEAARRRLLPRAVSVYLWCGLMGLCI